MNYLLPFLLMVGTVFTTGCGNSPSPTSPIAMKEDTIAIARTLFASPSDEMVEVWVRSFKDDVEAHDDNLQKRLEQDVVTAFNRTRVELEAAFGPPVRLGDEDEELIPLGGVLRFAVWKVDDKQLWLAAAHEDRDCPFLLLMGTVPDNLN